MGVNRAGKVTLFIQFLLPFLLDHISFLLFLSRIICLAQSKRNLIFFPIVMFLISLHSRQNEWNIWRVLHILRNISVEWKKVCWQCFILFFSYQYLSWFEQPPFYFNLCDESFSVVPFIDSFFYLSCIHAYVPSYSFICLSIHNCRVMRSIFPEHHAS